jgi:hypothetical protein
MTQAIEIAATIINGMRARMIGRVLGIGVRVLGRMAGQPLGPQAQPTVVRPQVRHNASAPSSQDLNRAPSKAPARTAMQAGQAVNRGVGGFLRPFRRVGGILWLEVTGVFFLLPVAVFAPALWRAILDYPHTADHKKLWVTAGVIAVFLYLGISSFWRAHRRSLQS